MTKGRIQVMDGGISIKFAMFYGGPKDGEVWQDLSRNPFIYKIAYRPTHGRTRHVYELTKHDDDFYFYDYDGVQIRDKKMRWAYVACE